MERVVVELLHFSLGESRRQAWLQAAKSQIDRGKKNPRGQPAAAEALKF